MPSATVPKVAKPHGFVPKRGRPTSTQLRAIEHSILTVACAMFLENGYANTSMDAVASDAGVSKGTLYSRYPDKASLFNGIVTDRLEAWSKIGVDSTLTHSGTLPDFLFRFATAFLRGVSEPEIAAFHRLINAEANRFPELAREFQSQGYEDTITRVTVELQRLSADQGWQIIDARGMIVAFNSALLGWYHAEALLREVAEDDCAAFASRLVNIFISGHAAW